MRFISTKFHSFLDYLVGVLLVASPWIFNFDNGGAAQWVPVIIGIMTIVMSIFTNYEGGIVKKIPMPAHLTMDIVAGIFLAASPWIFGFAELVYLPHLIVGIMEVGAGLCTHKVPYAHAKTHQPLR